MRIKTSYAKGVPVIWLEGKLDNRSLVKLRSEFAERRHRRENIVVADLRDVVSINYRVLGLLVEEAIDLRAAATGKPGLPSVGGELALADRSLAVRAA